MRGFDEVMRVITILKVKKAISREFYQSKGGLNKK